MADNPAEEVPAVDPHHRVPEDQWGQVLRDAKAFRLEAEQEGEAK